MKFNWMNLIGAIPYVVMGIQQMHAEVPGATKKQLALQALGLATATAETAAADTATQQTVDTLGKSAGAGHRRNCIDVPLAERAGIRDRVGDGGLARNRSSVTSVTDEEGWLMSLSGVGHGDPRRVSGLCPWDYPYPTGSSFWAEEKSLNDRVRLAIETVWSHSLCAALTISLKT